MYNILRQCRRWTEIVAEDKFPANLCGLCAVAAGRVNHKLRKAGIRSSIIYNRNHVFNLVGNQLVDITATQFNLPEVFVTDYPASDWFYHTEKLFRDYRQLAGFQQREGWPADQIYLSYVYKKTPGKGSIVSY